MEVHHVDLTISAVAEEQYPKTDYPEIALVGRSNVGKSSLTNVLINRKNFAHTSSQPGKTQTLNFYNVEDQLFFVDVPGYGYAKVSQAERDRWGKLMEDFFATPGLIDLGVMIVDARHKPTADDVTMAEWFKSSGCRLVVVANKLDKLKKSEIEPNMQLIRETLTLPGEVLLIPFSAEKGQGRETLLAEIVKLI